MKTKKSTPARTKSKSTSKSGNSPERLDVNKQTSCEIRQIENGFLISESGYVGKGRNQQYVSKQYYSPVNPVAAAKIPTLKLGKK